MRNSLLLLFIATVCLYLSHAAVVKLAVAENSPSTCMKTDCTAPDRWFENGKTPKVIFTDFPTKGDDECAFYRWGWQSFLYLTQSDSKDGDPRFIGFANQNELFDSGADTKTQVTAAPKRKPNAKKALSLSVRNSPRTSRQVTTSAFDQAGLHGVVVDHNHRCLYYAQHFNEDYVDYIKNKLGLRTPDQIAKVADTEQFPVGTIELKSSWRVLTDEEKKTPESLAAVKKRWFVIDAEVPTLFSKTVSGVTVVKADADRPLPETVALVGLHVVGVTPGHPEFVWASFEHIDNSPTPSKAGLGPEDPVNADREFTFYKRGTKVKESNVNPVDDGDHTPPIPLSLTDSNDPKKQTLNPVVEIYRLFNSGEDFIGLDGDVCTLNGSVHDKLNAIPELAVWSNYQMIGAIWIKDPAVDFKPGSQYPNGSMVFAGETKLSNSTMETFTQTVNENCFGCHRAAQEKRNGKTFPGLRIGVSHGLRNAFFGPDE